MAHLYGFLRNAAAENTEFRTSETNLHARHHELNSGSSGQRAGCGLSTPLAHQSGESSGRTFEGCPSRHATGGKATTQDFVDVKRAGSLLRTSRSTNRPRDRAQQTTKLDHVLFFKEILIYRIEALDAEITAEREIRIWNRRGDTPHWSKSSVVSTSWLWVHIQNSFNLPETWFLA